nr:sulfite exporter TauE/SafE family protein [Methanobacterium formicicum]
MGHWRRGAVLTGPAIILGTTGIIGGVLGAVISSQSPAALLSFIFGILALGSALWMIASRYPEIDKDPSHPKQSYLFWGFLGGFSSGLLGIGGGVVMVPLLNILLKFPIRKAIGTSTAFIIFASLGGIATYIFTGINATGLPPYSVGYVNLLQFVALAGTSIPMARVGVKAAHNIPEKKVKIHIRRLTGLHCPENDGSLPVAEFTIVKSIIYSFIPNLEEVPGGNSSVGYLFGLFF